MLLSGLAVGCSVALVVQHKPRVFPIVALVASGLELLIALNIVHLNISIPINLILGAALAVAGVAVYLKTSAKWIVSVTTVLTLIGAMQVASALHLHVL